MSRLSFKPNVLWFVFGSLLFLLSAFSAVLFIEPWGQFPLNDDWVYTKNVLDTLRNGTFTVRFGQFAWAIPQVLLGITLVPSEAPFAVFRGIGIASSFLAAPVIAWLCYRALHGAPKTQSFRSPSLILVGAFSCFFFAPYLQPAFSFMTDLPAFLFWTLSLLTTALFLQHKKWTYLVLAVAVNALAIAERQLALLIPFSMALYNARGFTFKNWKVFVPDFLKRASPFLFFLIPYIGIQIWWSYISPLVYPTPGFSPNPGFFVRASRYVTYLGWMALPFFAFSPCKLSEGAMRPFRWAYRIYGFGLFLHVVTAFTKDKPLLMPFLDMVLGLAGFLPLMLGITDVHMIFPVWFRVLLTVLGICGAWRILEGFALLVADKQRSEAANVILCSSLTYLVFICLRVDHCDRYAIPMMPLSLLCLMRTCDLRKINFKREVSALLLVIPTALFSVTLLWDYFRWNEARWLAIAKAESLGVAKKNINAGHEYMGWSENNQNWGTPNPFEYIVSFSELPGLTTVETFPYRAFWGRHEQAIYLQRAH